MPGQVCTAAALTAAALRTLSCTALLLVASCATAPERNAIDITKSPQQWASANTFNNPITAQWLSSFADRTLTALV